MNTQIQWVIKFRKTIFLDFRFGVEIHLICIYRQRLSESKIFNNSYILLVIDLKLEYIAEKKNTNPKSS